MRPDFIIGTDFLNTNIVTKGKALFFRPKEDIELPEIFQIDCMREQNELDVADVNQTCFRENS